MESEPPVAMSAREGRESEWQCRVRDANEAAERALTRSPIDVRCECGDPACSSRITLTRPEYEDVRAYGSRFVVGVNHENPESACVLGETSGFAVIDVVSAGARYHVLARNPRHAWPGAGEGRPR